jgi:hypothetical protein
MPAPKKYSDELKSARCVSCSSPSARSRTSRAIWASMRKRCGCGCASPKLTPARATTALTSDERERLKALERENRELRKANEILSPNSPIG